MPDSKPLLMSDIEMMTFCTSEIRAFQLAARPYLVDFPISKPLKLMDPDLGSALSSCEWVSYRITTGLQQRNWVTVFTLFPTDVVLSRFSHAFGDELASCIDIVKVRAFGQRSGNSSWLRVIPLVALKPIAGRDVGRILDYVLDRLNGDVRLDRQRLNHNANSSSAKFRLIQYVLSAALGQRFAASVPAQCHLSR